MNWWQIALAVWLGGWVVLFVLSQVIASKEPTYHGQEIITQMGCIAFVWPICLLWLPFAGVWALIEKLTTGKDQSR